MASVPKSPGHPARGHKWRLRLIWVSVVVVLLWLLVSTAVVSRLTRRKMPRFDEPVPTVSWSKLEGLRLKTSDAQELGAWFVESPVDGPSVILLHGNGGHRTHNLSRAEILHSVGCSSLLVTLRAHGDSSGDFNDIGYSARHDVVAAVESLEKRRPGRPILILGSSLGAAAALFASRELGERVAGYFLEAPYLDLRTAVRNRTREHLPIGLEWIAYQGLVLVSPPFVPDLDQTSPLKASEGIPSQVPVHLLVGRHDFKTTPEQVGRIFAKVRSHGTLVIFEQAGHLGYLNSDLGEYRKTLIEFVDQATHR